MKIGSVLFLAGILFTGGAQAIDYKSIANSQESYGIIGNNGGSYLSNGDIAFATSTKLWLWSPGTGPNVREIYSSPQVPQGKPNPILGITDFSTGYAGRVAFYGFNSAGQVSFAIVDPESNQVVGVGNDFPLTEAITSSGLEINAAGETAFRVAGFGSGSEKIYKNGVLFVSPNPGQIGSLGNPVIAPNGTVAFPALDTRGSPVNIPGIFKGPNPATDALLPKAQLNGRFAINENGVIAFSGGYTDNNNAVHSGIFLLNAETGAVTQVSNQLLSANQGIEGFRGNTIVYIVCQNDENCSIRTMNVENQEVKTIVSSGDCVAGQSVRFLKLAKNSLDSQGLPAFHAVTTGGLSGVFRALPTDPAYGSVEAVISSSIGAVIGGNSKTWSRKLLQNAVVGQTITLNGSGSSESFGNDLEYVWQVIEAPSQSEATFSPSPNRIITGFTFDAPGQYRFRLNVKSCGGAQDSEDLYVTVAGFQNTPPAPTAPPIIVIKNTTGSVEISHNDPDQGQTHTYAVTNQGEKGQASMNGNVATYSPTDPDYIGPDEFTVTVTDSMNASGTVLVSVQVVEEQVGGDVEAVIRSASKHFLIGRSFTLDGSSSRGEGLNYLWSVEGSGQDLIITGATSATPSLKANKAGTYTVKLRVKKGETGPQDEATFSFEVKEAVVTDPPGAKNDQQFDYEKDLLGNSETVTIRDAGCVLVGLSNLSTRLDIDGKPFSDYFTRSSDKVLALNEAMKKINGGFHKTEKHAVDTTKFPELFRKTMEKEMANCGGDLGCQNKFDLVLKQEKLSINKSSSEEIATARENIVNAILEGKHVVIETPSPNCRSDGTENKARACSKKHDVVAIGVEYNADGTPYILIADPGRRAVISLDYWIEKGRKNYKEQPRYNPYAGRITGYTIYEVVPNKSGNQIATLHDTGLMFAITVEDGVEILTASPSGKINGYVAQEDEYVLESDGANYARIREENLSDNSHGVSYNELRFQKNLEEGEYQIQLFSKSSGCFWVLIHGSDAVGVTNLANLKKLCFHSGETKTLTATYERSPLQKRMMDSLSVEKVEGNELKVTGVLTQPIGSLSGRWLSLYVAGGFFAESLEGENFVSEGSSQLYQSSAAEGISYFKLENDGAFEIRIKGVDRGLDPTLLPLNVGLLSQGFVYEGFQDLISKPKNSVTWLKADKNAYTVGERAKISIYQSTGPSRGRKFLLKATLNGMPIALVPQGTRWQIARTPTLEAGKHAFVVQVFEVDELIYDNLQKEISSLRSEESALEKRLRENPGYEERERISVRLVSIEQLISRLYGRIIKGLREVSGGISHLLEVE